MLAHLTIRPSAHQMIAEPQIASQGCSPTSGTSRPVAAPVLASAVKPPDRAIAAGPQFQPPPAPASAEAAAEAARQAYIRASIAAGLNPLPLPGR